MRNTAMPTRFAGGVVALAAAAATFVATAGSAFAALTPEQEQQMLAQQNQYRAEVGTPPVQWNGSLATAAQQVADNAARTGSGGHSPTSNGENIYWGGGTVNPVDAVANWYGERQAFLAGNVGAAGHYTQMVSSRVQSVGCGSATGSGRTYVVCQYQPNGNDGQPPF